MGATLTSRTYPPPNGSRHTDPRAHTRPRADGPPERVAGTPSTAITRLSVLIATPSRPRVQHPGSHGLSPVRLAPLAPLRHYSRQQTFSIARSFARSLGLLGISGLPVPVLGPTRWPPGIAEDDRLDAAKRGRTEDHALARPADPMCATGQ